VFRKGIVLLGPEEMDGDYAGEDLRREVCVFLSFLQNMTLIFAKLLEAMVERPPPRPLTDEFGLEILNTPREMIVHSPTTMTSTSTDPSSNTHTPLTSAGESQNAPTPTTQLPRPYIPRSTRSNSNSILGVISPGSGSVEHGSSTPAL
jgi:protein phosphatase 1 regulatory subunit 37